MAVKRKTITLEFELLKNVERIAKEEDRSFSNMVQRIITEWLEALYEQNKEWLDKLFDYDIMYLVND